MAAGAVGLALTIPNFLPPLIESIVLGSSLGLVLVGPLSGLVSAATTPGKAKPTTEARLKQLVAVRRRDRVVEHQRILDNFDSLLSRVEEIDDPVVNKKVTENFERFVDKLTKHYPQWDGEGRLRTYVLMKKIADSLDLHNADAYLRMAYGTLKSRGAEATELSHITLNGKVERIYRDPESERARHLAGTLLLMNRGDDDYAKGMVVDAIHLWSDTRFAKLKEDFAAVHALGTQVEGPILDMLEKEIVKTERAKDVKAASRARDLWVTILSSDPRLAALH